MLRLGGIAYLIQLDLVDAIQSGPVVDSQSAPGAANLSVQEVGYQLAQEAVNQSARGEVNRSAPEADKPSTGIGQKA